MPRYALLGDLVRQKRVLPAKLDEARQPRSEALRDANAGRDPAREPEGGQKP
jgi:hypothetical protein